MIISGIDLKGASGYAHQAVYGPLRYDPYIRRGLENPPETLEGFVRLSSRSSYALSAANLFALIYFRHQGFLNHMAERDDLDPAVRQALPSMMRCMPAGVYFDVKRRSFYCRKYAVCPWCRFRKAEEIIRGLGELRSEAKQLAFITLALPAALLPLATTTFMEDHRELIRIICKRRKLFFADQVVTIPRWRWTGGADGSRSGGWSLSIETTIIGLMKEQGALPLLEECLSKVRRSRMVAGGTGTGTWSVSKPTLKAIQYAVGCSMGYSASLFSKRLNAAEYQTALGLQSAFHSAAHGAMRPRCRQRSC